MGKWSYGSLKGGVNNWMPNPFIKGKHTPFLMLKQLLVADIMLKRVKTHYHRGQATKYGEGYKYYNLCNLKRAGYVTGKGIGPWKITDLGRWLVNWQQNTDKELFPYMFSHPQLVARIKAMQKKYRRFQLVVCVPNHVLASVISKIPSFGEDKGKGFTEWFLSEGVKKDDFWKALVKGLKKEVTYREEEVGI